MSFCCGSVTSLTELYRELSPPLGGARRATGKEAWDDEVASDSRYWLFFVPLVASANDCVRTAPLLSARPIASRAASSGWKTDCHRRVRVCQLGELRLRAYSSYYSSFSVYFYRITAGINFKIVWFLRTVGRISSNYCGILILRYCEFPANSSRIIFDTVQWIY